jgi:TonB-dependent SusC/RagA subfamily outer membrane receptor
MNIVSLFSIRCVFCVFAVATVACVAALNTHAQDRTEIKGRVTDAGDKQEVVGATVSATSLTNKTVKGAVTSRKGEFSITGLEAGKYRVTVKAIGYKNYEQTLEIAQGAVSELAIALAPDALRSEEVIVTGNAGLPTSKLRLGNAIGLISEKDIDNTPTRSVGQLLDARTTGVQIWNSSGLLGATPQIQLRGVGNLNGNSAPLIFIDGVRITNTNTNETGSVDGRDGQSVSTLNFINPADIERVEILKGASAATLYGSDAANGVIQIFTKSGANATSPLSFSFSSEVRKYDWSLFYPKMSRAAEEFVNAGTGLGHTQNLNVRGKADRFSFFAGVTVRGDNNGMKASNQNFTDFKANITFTPDNLSSIKFGASYTRDLVSRPDADNNNQATSGWFSQLMKQDSVGAGQDFRNPFTGILFFRDGIYDKLHNDVASVRQSGNLQYSRTLPADIKLEVRLGYENITRDQLKWTEQGFVNSPNGSRRQETTTIESYTLYGTLAKRFELAERFTLDVSAGVDYYNTNRFRRAQGSNTFDPGFDEVVQFGLGTTVTAFEERTIFATGSVFGQGQFAYDERLFVTLGVRADKSSSFGGDAPARIYPKASASYLLPVEGITPALSTAKLRASFGFAGKQPDPGAADLTFARQDIFTIPSTVVSRPGNPQLTPSLTNEAEAGLDISLFEGRAGVEFTYYQQNVTSDLFNVRTAPSQGFGGREQFFNLGRIRTVGLETSVFANVQLAEQFVWDSRVNVSTVDNTVLDDGGFPFTAGPFAATPFVRVQTGRRVAEIYLPVTVINQYGTASNAPTPTFFGPVTPTLTGNWTNTFTIARNLSLNVNIGWATGMYVWNLTRANMHRNGIFDADFTEADMAAGTAASRVAEMQRTPDQVAALTKFNQQTTSQSSVFIERGDFVKLREATLSYVLPDEWFGSALRNFTVSVSGNNLLLISGYKGFDPEVSVGGSSLLNRGADNRSIPNPRVLIGRVSFQF